MHDTHCITTRTVPPRGTQLSFAELEAATQGFSDLNEIGGGASCAVYRGQV
jgi:hypothetical protein